MTDTSIMNDLTVMLNRIQAGDSQAAAQLTPMVYDELRRLAGRQMANEARHDSLQATALVHEAWLRLVGDGQSPQWENRRHFFGAAAQAMRRILVDRARRRKRLRHGGQVRRVLVDIDKVAEEAEDQQILALHEALDALFRHDATKSQLVELRFFAGLTLPEAARVLQISPSTADRMWRYARAWLYTAMSDSDENLPES